MEGRYPRPKYKRWRAVLYGSFIDWAILLRVPLGDNVFGCIARHRGPEQIRLLLALALFDADGDGEISETELEEFEKHSEEIISDGKQMCVNLSLVSVMLVGLLHNVTIGRPVAFAFGAGAEEQYGGWLLWLAYGLNLTGESGAFFTMCLSIITRNCLTNVLPTRQHKVDSCTRPMHLGLWANPNPNPTPASCPYTSTQGGLPAHDQCTWLHGQLHAPQRVVLPFKLDRARAYNQPNARLAWCGPTLATAVRLHVLHRATALSCGDATARGGGARPEGEGGVHLEKTLFLRQLLRQLPRGLRPAFALTPSTPTSALALPGRWQ